MGHRLRVSDRLWRAERLARFAVSFFIARRKTIHKETEKCVIVLKQLLPAKDVPIQHGYIAIQT
jgi:hypothetical protein